MNAQNEREKKLLNLLTLFSEQWRNRSKAWWNFVNSRPYFPVRKKIWLFWFEKIGRCINQEFFSNPLPIVLVHIHTNSIRMGKLYAKETFSLHFAVLRSLQEILICVLCLFRVILCVGTNIFITKRCACWLAARIYFQCISDTLCVLKPDNNYNNINWMNKMNERGINRLFIEHCNRCILHF